MVEKKRPTPKAGVKTSEIKTTAQKRRAAKPLSESEASFRSIYENIGIGIALIGKDMEILSINPQMQKWFPNIRSGERPICYRSFNVPPRDKVCDYCPTVLTLKDGRTHSAVTDTPTPDGVRHYKIIATPLLAADGSISAIEMVEDITEHKQTETALRESEEKFSKSFQKSPLLFTLSEIDSGKLLEVNEKFLEVSGFKQDEVIGRTVVEIGWNSEEQRSRQRQSFLDHGRVAEMELILRRKDGREINCLYNGEVITVGGKPRLLSIAQDITERVDAERRLKESEDRFRSIFEQAIDGIMIADPEKKKNIEANSTICAMLGYTRDEIVDISVEKLHPKEDLPRVLDMFARQVRGEISLAQDIPMLRKDGTVLYVDVNAALVTLGGKQCLIGIFRDITERKQADAALREREKQLAESQRIAHIGSWEHNLTTGKVVWSDELFRILGLDPQKNTGNFKMFFDRIHPADQPVLKKAIDETVKTGKQFRVDYRYLLPDGKTRILRAQAELIPDEAGNRVVLSGTGQDITDQKLTEEKIRAKNTMLQTLIHAIPDMVFFKDPVGRFLLVNKAMEEATGLKQEEIVGKTDNDLSPPDVAEKCKQSDADAVKSGGPSYSEERYADKNGEARFLDVVKAPIYDDKGELNGLVVVGRNITGRKLAEEKIRQSEEFIRSILDTVDEGFIVIDRDYRILTANKAYCSQVSLPCKEVIGKHCYEISHNNSRPCYEEGEECAVRQVFATGEPHAVLHKHADRDGHVLYVETKGFPIKDASGNVTSVIETINNITEKHLLEEERLKTQKLESIGTLAGGIAHDFNNLLQGIFGYISMAKMTLEQPEKSRTMLEQAEKALHMSVGLTSQLLTFSRGGKPVKKLVPIVTVIENAVKFALSGSRLDYRIHIDKHLSPVEADEGQLGQVLQNIVLNADQAMPLGGRLEIAARNVHAPDQGVPQTLKQGDYVEMSIKDSGIGIPEDFLPRIFDPYFTTKEKGSGLGLATSYSIIKNHDGLIDVQSEVGKGSIFTIYLPSATVAEAVVTSPAAAPAGRKGRILVMDDEDIVRMVAGELIISLGHEVDFAEHGADAIEKYQQSLTEGKPFDIVILDLTVRGGMGGDDAIKNLRAIDPDVTAIVSSGYSDNAIVSNYHEHGFSASLQKPYDVYSLQDVLNSLLTEKL